MNDAQGDLALPIAALPAFPIDPAREAPGAAVPAPAAAGGAAGRAAPAAPRPGQAELMPAFLECAHAHASVGEQVRVLKEVFGEYRDPGYF